ncbi:MAG: hypothetical protein U9Q99_01505 [Nanoarchaeota archaeon]|nr:hypothetical protein [Nanoarchaeota archaeon]
MEIDTSKMQNLGFSQLKTPEISENTSFMNRLGKGKIEALKKSVNEINEMVGKREELSEEIFNECEKLKSEINLFLSENEKNVIGASDAIKEKNELRKKKVEVTELQVNEKVSCWKDVALLKKELRETERQLSEKQERIDSLSQLMEEN